MKVELLLCKDVAELCGCSLASVNKYAQKHEAELSFVSSGKRKTFVWFSDDIERFKNRVVVMGRPKGSK